MKYVIDTLADFLNEFDKFSQQSAIIRASAEKHSEEAKSKFEEKKHQLENAVGDYSESIKKYDDEIMSGNFGHIDDCFSQNMTAVNNAVIRYSEQFDELQSKYKTLLQNIEKEKKTSLSSAEEEFKFKFPPDEMMREFADFFGDTSYKKAQIGEVTFDSWQLPKIEQYAWDIFFRDYMFMTKNLSCGDSYLDSNGKIMTAKRYSWQFRLPLVIYYDEAIRFVIQYTDESRDIVAYHINSIAVSLLKSPPYDEPQFIFIVPEDMEQYFSVFNDFSAEDIICSEDDVISVLLDPDYKNKIFIAVDFPANLSPYTLSLLNKKRDIIIAFNRDEYALADDETKQSADEIISSAKNILKLSNSGLTTSSFNHINIVVNITPDS